MSITAFLQQARDRTQIHGYRAIPGIFVDLSLTHKSSQDLSGMGSVSTTEILGIYSFSISLEQL